MRARLYTQPYQSKPIAKNGLANVELLWKSSLNPSLQTEKLYMKKRELKMYLQRIKL